MQVLKVILAIILTGAMLYVARSNSMGQPDELLLSEHEYTIEMVTVPKIEEGKSDAVTLTLSGPVTDDTQVWFRANVPQGIAKEEIARYSAIPMQRMDGTTTYTLRMNAGDKGGKLYYYFDVTNGEGELHARFFESEGEPFLLKYIGAVPPWILLGHLVFIFATVFFVSLALVDGLRAIVTGDHSRPVMRALMWATIFCFIGMIPFGIPMNWYAFGATWEGVPFGHDATDNKTQLLFVFLLFVTLSGWASLRKKRSGFDSFPPAGLGALGLLSFGVMLFIYLIPHSIQFSPEFTYTFCYSWIGAVIVLYLIGRLNGRQAHKRMR